MDDLAGEVRRLARRGAVALIAAASVAVGLLLIWYFVRPDLISRVTTAQMLVVLGLFLMPVVTLAAWEIERRCRARAPVPPPAPAGPSTSGRAPESVADPARSTPQHGPEHAGPGARRLRHEDPHNTGLSRPPRADAAGRRLPARPPRAPTGA